MKKLIAVLALAMTVGGSWWAYTHLAAESEKPANQKEVRYSARGQKLFWAKMRHDPSTGELPIDLVIKAREDAKYYEGLGYRGALNLEWDEMGPDNQGGRTRAILIDRNDHNRMYAGGVTGGLFVSTNGGATWNRVPGSDNFSNHVVSCIAQADNGNIYFGTGEFFPMIFANNNGNVTGAGGFIGGGVWASTDNGQSWSNIQAPTTQNSTGDPWAFVHKMTKDKTDGNTIWLGNHGNTAKSLWKIDATNNNVSVFSGTLSTGVIHDVESGTDGSLHVARGIPGGGTGITYLRKKAGEANFSTVAIPGATGLTRLEIAISPSHPNVIYYVGIYYSAGDFLRGVWRTDDGGETFTQIAGQESNNTSTVWQPMRGQGVYNCAAGVHPTNPDLFVMGGIDVYRYTPTNGFQKISNWTASIFSPNYVHADIHDFVFKPSDPNVMYVVNDGGVYRTANVSASQVVWSTKNTGYITTQFYSVTAKNYTGELIGGTQDNGNWLIDFNGNTIRWGLKIKSGDGGDVAVSTINPNIIFAEYVYGDLARSSNNGASFGNMLDANVDPDGDNTPGTASNPGAPFIMQFELWENQYDTNHLSRSKFFIGTNNRVWMTQEALDLTKTPTWFRITKNPISGAVSAIESTKDGRTLFVGTETGNLYRITGLDSILYYTVSGTTSTFDPDQFGITVDLINTWSGGRPITGIDIWDGNDNTVVITLASYGAGITEYVARSTNAMAAGNAPTFTNISLSNSGLPRMPVYSVLIDPVDANKIIIGTELGVYSTANGGAQWTIEEQMPRVPVLKMRRHKLYDASSPTGVVDNVIVAGTYGRGIWRTRTMQYTGVENPVAQKGTRSFGLYPNPTHADATVRVDLGSNTDVVITVYSVSGQQMQRIQHRNQTAGTQTYNVPSSDLPNGTYLVKLEGRGLNASQKLVVLR